MSKGPNKPMIGTDPGGKEYLFPSKNAALEFVVGRRPGGLDAKELGQKMEMRGWKFRYLNENEIIYYYEKVLCQQGGEEYGPDARPQSGTSNSRE